jgi:hypothetical protein
LLPPSLARIAPRNLTPASGCQDHTTSPSAAKRLRQRAACVHRIPHPTSVTIAIRPSCGCGITMDGEVICGRGKRKYFCKGGWTGVSVIARRAVMSSTDRAGVGHLIIDFARCREVRRSRHDRLPARCHSTYVVSRHFSCWHLCDADGHSKCPLIGVDRN